MALKLYLYDGDELIEEKSDKYPEHAFHQGYLFSNSNEMGFNQFVYTVIGKDFYTIFDPIYAEEMDDGITDAWTENQWFFHDHPIYPKAHLEKALTRVREVIEELKTLPDYGVKTFETYADTPNINTQEALLWAKTESEKQNNYTYETKYKPNHSSMGWFSFHSPLKVVAVIPASFSEETSEMARLLFPGNNFSTRGVHIVYEVEGLMQHYIEMAEICQEFIEKALTLKEPRIGGFHAY